MPGKSQLVGEGARADFSIDGVFVPPGGGAKSPVGSMTGIFSLSKGASQLLGGILPFSGLQVLALGDLAKGLAGWSESAPIPGAERPAGQAAGGP
jgi:hypothetical protein